MKTCPRCGTQNRDVANYCSRCQYHLIFDLNGRLCPGVVLDRRYEIIRVLSTKGGMAAIYQAYDQRFSRQVCVVKEMRDRFLNQQERQLAIQYFEREALLLRQIQHTHIPRVFDHFCQHGRYYLVMDYIDGDNLDDIVENTGQPVPENTVVEWAIQICDVLEYLHGQQPPIIFRDLKPANIMLDRNGQIKLVDFGIARHFTASRTGTPIGTPEYCPKEQYQGQAEPGSDIYALGATIHHLLTGRHPNPFDFPPVRSLNPVVSSALEAIVAKALGERVTDRYLSAREMRETIEALNAMFKIDVDFVHPILEAQSTPLCQLMLKIADAATTVSHMRTHFCLMLDVSGSMKYDGQGDVSHEKYWPLLRATEHLVKKVLSDTDLLTIVLFAKKSQVLLSARLVEDCKQMNIGGKSGLIDSSAIAQDPGDNTTLKDALASIHDITQSLQNLSLLHRIMILTDGVISDLESCCKPDFDTIRQSSVEIAAYGFGSDWQVEPLRTLLTPCRGGSFKQVPTRPTARGIGIEETFERFAQVSKNIVATDVELDVEFAPFVNPAAVFKYGPTPGFLKDAAFVNNVFKTGVEALQKGMEYSWCFEARLPPSQPSIQQIGLVTLSYTSQGRKLAQRQSIVVKRSSDAREYKLKLDEVEEAFTYLEKWRSKDLQKQIRALEAEFEFTKRKGHDPERVNALQAGVDILKQGGRLTDLPLEIQILIGSDSRRSTVATFTGV